MSGEKKEEPTPVTLIMVGLQIETIQETETPPAHFDLTFFVIRRETEENGKFKVRVSEHGMEGLIAGLVTQVSDLLVARSEAAVIGGPEDQIGN
jgi:hypothetical protein